MKAIFLLILLIFSSCLIELLGQEVVLIRHAKVDMDAKGWMRARKAAEYRKSYDVSPIHDFVSDEVLDQLPVLNSDTIYTSALYRSKESANCLFGDSAFFVAMPMLNEYELHVVRWPLILPYKGWTRISRVMWLLGKKKEGVESHKEAKERTKEAVDFIEEKSLHNQQVVLVTHGFLNRNIGRELEKRGWTRTLNNGKTNLGATVLRKN
ncbi:MULTISPECIES: histidine phosphatase family protein [unclassified Saccharicrinis]|uniref:histidine phosphatase family protein n=1 Tax=unclassified Saccharicrinis TaxID=2646859 RepID=UPI003D32BB61